MSEGQQLKQGEMPWTLHDMMVPGGRTAKLIRVPVPASRDFAVDELADKFNWASPAPVIVLAGAES